MSAVRLAFSGRSGSGKDSVAEAVYARLGLEPVRLSFGGHVVAEVQHACRLAADAASGEPGTRELRDRLQITAAQAAELVDRVAAGQGPGTRELLQWWGADVRRATDERHWLDRLAGSVGELPVDTAAYVADCRFPDELALVSSLGFTTVHVHADDEIRDARRARRDGRSTHPDAHATETSVSCADDHDHVVDNSSSIDDAAAALAAALDRQPGAPMPRDRQHKGEPHGYSTA